MNLVSKKRKERTPAAYPLTDEKFRQLDKVAARIEKMRLGDYIQTMNRPGHLIWTNFLIGVSRGVGLTIGATVVIALLFKLIGILISMNIPYLTEMLQEVVQIVKETPGIEQAGHSENMNTIIKLDRD